MLDRILDISWLEVIFAVGIIALALWAAIADDQNWDDYAAMHHCRQTGRVDSSTGVGVGGDGKSTVVVIPEKKIYTCDGGEMRIR